MKHQGKPIYENILISFNFGNDTSPGTKYIEIPPNMQGSLHLPPALTHNRQKLSSRQNLPNQT